MMSRKDLYIHIGLAKTGTKAIQFALARRRSKLQRAGWIFPKEGTSNSETGHHALSWFIDGATHQHPGLKRFDPAAFKRAIEAAAEKNIIISSEGFSNIRSDQDIRSLMAYFPNHDVRVVAYVREQTDFINSIYGQFVRDLHYPGTIEDFAARNLADDRYNYRSWLHRWKSLLGERFIVRPYDRAHMAGGDAVKDFAQLLHIEEVLKPYPSAERNLRVNAKQMAVLAGICEILKGRDYRWSQYSNSHRRLKQVVGRILDEPELQDSPPYWGLSESWSQKLKDHYAASNAAFFAEMGLGQFEFHAGGGARSMNELKYLDLPQTFRERIEQSIHEELNADQV